MQSLVMCAIHQGWSQHSQDSALSRFGNSPLFDPHLLGLIDGFLVPLTFQHMCFVPAAGRLLLVNQHLAFTITGKHFAQSIDVWNLDDAVTGEWQSIPTWTWRFADRPLYIISMHLWKTEQYMLLARRGEEILGFIFNEQGQVVSTIEFDWSSWILHATVHPQTHHVAWLGGDGELICVHNDQGKRIHQFALPGGSCVTALSFHFHKAQIFVGRLDERLACYSYEGETLGMWPVDLISRKVSLGCLPYGLYAIEWHGVHFYDYDGQVLDSVCIDMTPLRRIQATGGCRVFQVGNPSKATSHFYTLAPSSRKCRVNHKFLS